MSADRTDVEAMAEVLHASGTCDAMFSHYGPAKKCERIAGDLADSPELDRIVARHVAEALDRERARLVKAIEECDPSDDYHRRDVRPGYYAGVDRAIRFIRGDITTWMDPKP